MNRPCLGVLALQGAVAEHMKALRDLGVPASEVRTVQQLDAVDGLILPGGESTTIGKLLERFALLAPLKRRADEGLALWGTCAGMILMAREVDRSLPGQPLLGVMDLRVERNAFGRQVDSFEAPVEVAGLQGGPFPAIFIRAPRATSAGPEVEILARVDRSIVAARQGRMLATSFHPELSGDLRMHRYFVDLVSGR
jgi:5'-phosphate synthase pdxT subunit